MGAKITFNPDTRKFECIGPPVDGVIEIDLQVDLYSDGKEDWLDTSTYPELSNMIFPINALGGNPFGATTFGDAYLIEQGWTFKPYEGHHVLRLIGDVGTDDGRQLVDTSIGNWTITIEYAQSALVKVVETGTSGLTQQESDALIDIAADQATITTDIASIDASLISQLAILTGIQEMELAEHITSPSLGIIIIRNTTAMRRWEAYAWEDEAMTVPYGTNSPSEIEAVGMITEVAWS